MKRIFAVVVFAFSAFGAPAAMAATNDADFGAPPSGIVPILFNDRHVYARPDELRNGRVLAALVQNGQIFVPLRSMFQEMGGTVTISGNEILVRADRTTVRLALGRPEVVIDGQTRPLDVPPMRYHGDVLVPVRVISEALAAYVAWLPQFRAVAIYYSPKAVPLPPAYLNPPSPASTGAASGPVPLATSAPRAVVPKGPPIPVGPPPSETFIEVNDVVAPRINDAYSPGDHGLSDQSLSVRGAIETDVFGVNFVIDGQADRYVFPTLGRLTTNLDKSRTFVPQFTAKDFDYDVHFGVQLTPQKYYLAFGYVNEWTNYGYPRAGGFGAGLEKLPELQHRFSFDGSAFYYPNVAGTCDCPTGSVPLSYALFQYRADITYSLPSLLFLNAGIVGDSTHVKSAPSGSAHFGPAVGLGLYF